MDRTLLQHKVQVAWDIMKQTEYHGSGWSDELYHKSQQYIDMVDQPTKVSTIFMWKF